MIRILATLLSITFVTSASADTSVWKNQRGSMMQLNSTMGSNAVDGYYTNNAPGFPNCAGVPYPLTGTLSGRKIIFTVVWARLGAQNCHSKTVWKGRMKGKTITTKWVLTTDSGKVYKGSDAFTRQ